MDTFISVLSKLLSHDNNVRSQAEEAYQQLLGKDPVGTASNLISALACPQYDKAVRVLSCVLCRQLVKSQWSQLDASTRGRIQQCVLQALEAEADIHLSRRICFVIIAEPKESLVQRSDLLPRVLELIRASGNGEKRLVFLFLLEMVAEFAVDSIVSHGLEKTVEVLEACLKDTSSVAAQLHAASALASLMLSMKDPRAKMGAFLSNAVPTIMAAIGSGLLCQGKESEYAVKALEAVTKLSAKCMWAFDASLGQVCTQLIEMADSDRVESGGRSLSLEFFNEVLKRRGKKVTENASFLQTCLVTLVKLQCVDEDWSADWEDDQQPNPDDMLEMNHPGMRGTALVTLFCIANTVQNAERFLKLVFDLLPRLLGSGSWQEKYAGLSTLAVIVQPQGEQLESILRNVMLSIEPFLRDPNPRLQYGACICLYELVCSEKLNGKVQEEYYSGLLSGVTSLISGNTVPAVKCCSCQVVSAIISYLPEDSQAKEDIVANYLDNVLRALVQTIQTGSLKVQADAMIALSSVALLAGEKFGVYYAQLLPGIKGVLSQPPDSTATELKIASMNCLASIAEAVGRERFAGDAMDIMRLILSDNVTSNLGELDGVFDFSKRVCKVLQDDFLPFVPHVLPSILQAVNVDVNVKLEDVADQGLEESSSTGLDGQLTMVQNIRGKGTFRVSANIYAYQARINALDAIDSIADSLGEKFAPFLEDCIKVVVPAISDKLHVQASITAAEASASLLHCAVKSVIINKTSFEPVTKFLVGILTPLLVSLERAGRPSPPENDKDRLNDTTPEQRAGFASAIERCMRICWYSGGEDYNPDGTRPKPVLRPPADLVENISIVLKEACLRSTERRFHAAQVLKEAGYEDEDVEEMTEEINEDEEALMSDLIDSIGYLIKLFGADYLPIFERVVNPFISQILHVDNNDALNCNAVCLYDDVVEHCGQGAHKYLDICFPAMIHYYKSEHALLRQAAVYGLGQVAQNAPEVFRPSAAGIVTDLTKLLNTAEAKLEENIDATENAVSVVGRICSLYSDAVNTAEILPVWLQFLPLRNDEDEARYSHELLCRLVEAKNPSILGLHSKENGNSNANMTKLLAILSELMYTTEGIVNRATKDRIPKIILLLKSLTSEATFFGLCNTLEMKQQQAIKQVL